MSYVYSFFVFVFFRITLVLDEERTGYIFLYIRKIAPLTFI